MEGISDHFQGLYVYKVAISDFLLVCFWRYILLNIEFQVNNLCYFRNLALFLQCEFHCIVPNMTSLIVSAFCQFAWGISIICLLLGFFFFYSYIEAFFPMICINKFFFMLPVIWVFIKHSFITRFTISSNLGNFSYYLF